MMNSIFKAKGSVSARVDKPFYMTGDFVTCSLLVDARESIDGRAHRVGQVNRDLKSRQRPPLVGTLSPSVDAKQQTVRFLCCSNRGTCTVQAAMVKNMYGPGDVPQIQVDVQNNAMRDIRAMRCELRCHVVVTTASHSHIMHTTLCAASFPGVPAGGAASQPQPFQLSGTHLYPRRNPRSCL
ncbi:Aste57867_15137 [Aphanomyces stellatus]|uniref:Aste57867_15137 protein n=1 Tax=Aphanomyces stellatus TaxID=120398 RepID=A0A485L3A0_9STRA|nr:hypothetical protein As57867_015081 [Aphanomyces stellatus]VFT91947.1 Aste57867_15137 [Aphanomyces stellatus]